MHSTITHDISYFAQYKYMYTVSQSVQCIVGTRLHRKQNRSAIGPFRFCVGKQVLLIRRYLNLLKNRIVNI